MSSKFRFYHPYTLTPQNDRLNVAIMACILVSVIYGCFKFLGALEYVWRALGV